jgi:hypothetical protein
MPGVCVWSRLPCDSAEPDEATTVRSFLEKFVDKTTVEQFVATVESRHQQDAPPQGWSDLVIIDYEPVATVLLQNTKLQDIQLPSFVVSGGNLGVEAVSATMEVIAKFATCLAIASGLATKLFDKNAFVMKNPSGTEDTQIVHPVLVMMMHELFEKATQLKKELTDDTYTMASSVFMTVFPKASMLQLVMIILQWHSFAENYALGKLVGHLEVSAAACETTCPRWSHIISADIYKGNLAKRQLLEGQTRAQLPPATEKLRAFFRSLTDLGDSWPLEKPVAEMAISADACSNVAGILDMAAEAMTIVAACNIIEDFAKTSEGKRMATQFLQLNEMKNFPKILESKLKHIASQ